METLIVLTNLPDRESAKKLAQHMIEQRLAACVNVLAECTSLYRWQGKIEIAHEVPVLIKTSAERYAEVERAILSQHPYELPEIVAVPVAAGLAQYLAWVENETCVL
ncbi:MAG: divalent-cation tolerance protein CutA [Burkholderiales bacterium]